MIKNGYFAPLKLIYKHKFGQEMNIKYVKQLAFTVTAVMMSSIVINFSVTSFVQADELAIAQNKSPLEKPSLTTKATKSILMAKLANLDHFSAF